MGIELTKSVSGSIGVSEEVRSVDERSIRDRSHHGDSDCLLLLSLGTDGRGPAENDGVDTVGTETEDDHRDISTGSVAWWQRGSEDETENSNNFAAGNVPGSLVVFTRSPRDKERSDTSDQIRGACLFMSISVHLSITRMN